MSKIIGPLIVSLLLLVACNDDNTNPEQAALDANRAIWSNAGITDYVFNYRRACFCAPEEAIVVTISNNVVTDAFFTPSGVVLSADRIAALRTIDGFFDLIQTSINAPVDMLDVRYNPTYGFPEQILIDESVQIADEEIMHYISNFQ